MTLVYFKESKRRRNDNGMTISLSRLAFGRRYYQGPALHERRDPKLSVNEEIDITSAGGESDHHPGH